MEKWIGKVAVVTGASAGIGEAIVADLAKAGINVVGLARRSEKIEEIAKRLGDTPGKIYEQKCDVSDLESVKEAFKWIENKFGSVHILINNAAILFDGRIIDDRLETSDKLLSVLDTNFVGAVYCTREAVRLITRSDDHGMIININSVAGNYVPFGVGMNLYAPSKHAMRAFGDVLRHELVTARNSKIRVTNLSPGAVKTDMAVAAGIVADKDLVYQHIPHLTSENVSETVMFLLQVPYNVNITQMTVQPVGEKV